MFKPIEIRSKGKGVEMELKRQNNGQVIVFIHGILEDARQFRKLEELAHHEGYGTCLFHLPGHGGSSQYFAKTSYKAWIQYVSRNIRRLARQYEEMILVGHSMGALLAICEATNNPRHIKALFLIDPPLSVHIWPRVIKSALTISFGKIKDSQPYTKAEYHAMGVEPLRLRDSIGWLRRYSELLSIVGYTRKQICKIHLPMFVVFAAKDEFVSIKGRKYFKNYQGKLEVLYLLDSGHFCYHHSDLITLERFYLKFIKSHKE